jgi:uncharacterized protein YbjQ (UPF0145 family)
MPAKKKKGKVVEEVEGVHVVTSCEVPGFETVETKGFVWGTSVRAAFVGKDILAALHILVGGEIDIYTRMINFAKHEVIKRMVENAKELGANGVVSVRMGTAQIVPGTIEIFAYGTAVTIRKKK